MRLRHLALVIAVFAGLLAGCARESGPVSVTATDFGFTGVADTVTGGVIEFRFKNEGKADHELAFVDIGDTSFETFKKEFPKILEGGPFPSWFRRVTGAGEYEPGETVTTTVTLPKGEWRMMCALDDAPGEGEKTTKPHYELGMYQEITVEGPEDVELPETEGGLFHAKDYTFTAPENLEAGKKEYAFVNDGPDQIHFMDLIGFPKGTTPQQAEAAFGKIITAPEDAPPPAGLPMPDEDAVVNTFVFSPGMGQTFEATLEAGRTYLAACFIQDRTGGPPHAIGHKMYKAFQVPA